VEKAVSILKMNDTDHLKGRILDAAEIVDTDALSRLWQELEYQMETCEARNGAYFELS
jgi:hypothetical protein